MLLKKLLWKNEENFHFDEEHSVVLERRRGGGGERAKNAIYFVY